MTALRPVVGEPPVAGGLDVDLPGRGVRLRATRWPGSGTPILLLHGLASTRRIWDLVVPGLAGLPVLALDQRGHGDSERPDGPYDTATAVADALTALDAVGASRVVAVGHSWGGLVALRLAAAAPERVLAVVSLDGPLGVLRKDPENRAQARELLTPPRLALPLDELREVLRAGPLGPWWRPEVEAAVLPLFGVGDDGLVRARLPFPAHMQLVDDLLDLDPAPLLSAVRAPTWLVACESLGAAADPWAAGRAAALEQARRLLAAPRILRWAGAVHDVPLQWPALVAGLVRAAAEDVSPRLIGEGAGA